MTETEQLASLFATGAGVVLPMVMAGIQKRKPQPNGARLLLSRESLIRRVSLAAHAQGG